MATVLSVGALWTSNVTGYVYEILALHPVILISPIKTYTTRVHDSKIYLLKPEEFLTRFTEGTSGTITPPAPTLNALSVGSPSATAGTPYSSPISGLTSGSTVTLTGAGAAGLSIAGAVITGTPTTAGTVNLVETLAGATNSPRTSTGVLTVAAAVALLNYPRLGLIGPSTVQLNSYGATSGGQRVGNLNTGPVVWSLMKDRRAQMLITTQSTGQFFNGDNQGDGGAVFSDYPAHITALATRFNGLPTEKKLVYYEAGRNDAQNNNATLSDYQTNTTNQLASIRSQIAPSKILVAKLWPKPSIYSSSDSSKNQGWLIGGALRQLVRDYNAWLDTYAASNPDVVLVDLYSRMVIDPANPNSDTIAGTTLSDYTHFNSKGAQLAEPAFRTALANLTTAQTYPTAPAGNVVPAFSGTGGTKTGTGVSGNVFDGWVLALSATGPTVVASQETIDGKAAQRLTISNTSGISTQGVNITLSRSGLAIPASGKVGFRLRLRVSASGVPMIPFYQLGSSTAAGVTANARTTAIIGLSDATGTVVGGAGTNFVNAGKTDLTTALDLWVESPSYLEAASGGSSVPLELLHTIGAGASGDTLVIDIIDVQTFTWPI